jgi:hypothetical protein
LTSLDWLCLTGQSLLEVTAGQVFTDDLGSLTGLRQKLAWYPDDVWRYVVAADWIRLGEDLPLLGRAGHRGDDVGSRVICGRMVNTAMHLAFLLSRRWPPYPKWLGTLLTQLPVTSGLHPALTADRWMERQEAVSQALAVLHQAQHIAGLPTTEGTPTEPFFDRPFLGIAPPCPTCSCDRSRTRSCGHYLPEWARSSTGWTTSVCSPAHPTVSGPPGPT